MMDDFSYKMLTSKFFVDDKLLPSKIDRVENCFKFLAEKASCSSAKSSEFVKKKIVSIELTFMKKWREAKSIAGRFSQDNEKWLHRTLQVRVRNIIFSPKIYLHFYNMFIPLAATVHF